MPKSLVEEQLTDALRMFGWRFIHQRPCETRRGWRTALTGDPGFPDFVAVRGTRMLYIEAKGKTNQLDADQIAWRDALIAAGAEYHHIRPADVEDFVKDVLARR